MIKWTEEKLKAEGYEIQNARITSADISTEDHCCATLRLTLEGNGWGCCYGGYCLGHGGTYIKQNEIDGGSGEGFKSILQIMWTIETDSFDELKGKYCRVATKGWGSDIKIIGNLIKDKWFDYGSFFEKEGENDCDC